MFDSVEVILVEAMAQSKLCRSNVIAEIAKTIFRRARVAFHNFTTFIRLSGSAALIGMHPQGIGRPRHGDEFSSGLRASPLKAIRFDLACTGWRFFLRNVWTSVSVLHDSHHVDFGRRTKRRETEQTYRFE